MSSTITSKPQLARRRSPRALADERQSGRSGRRLSRFARHRQPGGSGSSREKPPLNSVGLPGVGSRCRRLQDTEKASISPLRHGGLSARRRRNLQDEAPDRRGLEARQRAEGRRPAAVSQASIFARRSGWTVGSSLLRGVRSDNAQQRRWAGLTSAVIDDGLNVRIVNLPCEESEESVNFLTLPDSQCLGSMLYAVTPARKLSLAFDLCNQSLPHTVRSASATPHRSRLSLIGA